MQQSYITWILKWNSLAERIFIRLITRKFPFELNLTLEKKRQIPERKKKRKKEKSKGMEICPVTYDNRLETILKRSFITVNSMYHWNTAVSEVSTFSSLLSSPFSGGWQLLEIRYISLARHLSRMSFSLKEFFELLHTQVLQWHFWMTKCVFNCSSRSCVIWFAIRLAIWGWF